MEDTRQITKLSKYHAHFAACGIDDEHLVELMECAWWALHRADRNALSTHLHLADWYMDELADKVHRYMNTEIK